MRKEVNIHVYLYVDHASEKRALYKIIDAYSMTQKCL